MVELPTMKTALDTISSATSVARRFAINPVSASTGRGYFICQHKKGTDSSPCNSCKIRNAHNSKNCEDLGEWLHNQSTPAPSGGEEK